MKINRNRNLTVRKQRLRKRIKTIFATGISGLVLLKCFVVETKVCGYRFRIPD